MRRWAVVGLLFFGMVISYMDRGNISIEEHCVVGTRTVKKFIDATMRSAMLDVDRIRKLAWRYVSQVRRLPRGTIADQNRTWHIALRTPDATITIHQRDLSHNHVVSRVPSIRPSRVSAKMTKHNMAASW